MTTLTRPATAKADVHVLAAVVEATRQAGLRLLADYDPAARPGSRAEMFAAGRRNEDTSLAGLREALEAARPGAGWVAEDQESGPLPPGEWWTVDAVEGNVNHVHGLPQWCVTVTLLRDQEPVLAVVYQPVGDLTYTAVRGGGAFLNGQRLHTSAKTDLDAAITGTGQAETGQADTYRRVGDSVAAMLDQALMVQATVPSTFPLLLVAAGQNDVFWQYQPVLPGIAAGILLASEAGGTVSRIDGSPWAPGSSDVLVAAPALHAAAVQVLATGTSSGAVS